MADRLILADSVDPRNLAFPIHLDGTDYTPYERGYNDAVISCYGMVVNAKTADAAPVVHGQWLGIRHRRGCNAFPVCDLWECSECWEDVAGMDVPKTHRWCPVCGAKMDRGWKDDCLIRPGRMQKAPGGERKDNG